MVYFEIEVFLKTKTKSFATPRLSIKSEIFSDAVEMLSETLCQKADVANITMWQIGTGGKDRMYEAIQWNSYPSYKAFKEMVLKTLGIGFYMELP